MTELDQQTLRWLNSLKINKTFTSISDFENGYNFGIIFDKLQLARGKKFKNNSDMGCIFQNYKNVRDILFENFNYDFPVNNIIYRTAQLLKVIKQITTNYVQQKKILTMKAATSISSGFDHNHNLMQPQEQKNFKNRQKQIATSAVLFNQTSKMPKKIQDIEKKLDKFRQQKTRHQLFALQQRKQQIDQYRRIVINNRDYEISKLKKLNEETKEKQKKVYDVWYKTQQIKKQRIQTDKQFQTFQRQKRNKLLQTLKKDQVDTINKGLQMFQLNCIRQGIDLQPDPTRPLKLQSQFNKVVVLQRIKDNLIRHQIDKKQRIKRQNKKKVEAQQAKIQSQLLWAQLNKVEDYSKKFSAHFGLCQTTYKVEKSMEAQQQTRKQKLQNKKFVDLPAYQDEQKREEQFRKRQVQYLNNDVKYIQKRWKKQQMIAEEVIQALMQVTIQGQQIFQKNQGFSYHQWKILQNRFLEFEDKRKKGKKDTKLYVDFSAFDNFLKQYLRGEGSWRNYHKQAKQDNINNNQLFTKSISEIINKSYPDLKAPQNQKIPLYMPLKVIFNGPKLSGKTTHSAKLAQKYGVIIINPKQIIKQAIQLAKPPVQQDPKKAAKKDTKKVQQPTAQKLALKQFGIKLLQKVNSFQQANTQHYLQAIKFKIFQNFKHKTQQQIVQQYKSAKQKQQLKYQQSLKQFQQAQKKPKKDSKKGGNQPVSEQPPKQNICFYSNGFVIDDFPQSQQSIKLLQRQLNCFITDEERINKNAVAAKNQMKLVLQIPEPPIDNSLKQGTFDLFLSLQSEQQQLLKRKTGRKIDPLTKIIYHPNYNPIPDIKGFADRLIQLPAPDDEQIKNSYIKFQQYKQKLHQFYSVFGLESGKINAYSNIKQGQEGVQQTFSQLIGLIQNLLQAKYKQIQNNAQLIKNKQPSNTQQKQQVQQNTQNNNQTQVNQNKPLNIIQLIQKNLTTQDSKHILNKYLTTVKTYQQKIKQCLFALDGERKNFSKQLLDAQKKFTNIINRPDDKAGKILGFQQNYNKLLAEQGNVVKDIQASKHLIQRLNQLYDSLWEAIGSKKNQAVQQRNRFKNSNWLNSQAQKIVEILKNLLQIQLNYLCQTIFVILILACKLQNKPSDYMNQYLSLGIAPQLQPIQSVQPDFNDLTTNRRITFYITQTNKCLQSLPAWIQQKYKKMKLQKLPTINNLMNNFVQYCKSNIIKKQQNIMNKVNQRILEQRSYYQTLVNKMDDWIIQGIKSQNDFVYDIYKNVKKCIQQAKKSNVKQLHVRQITQILNPIKQLTYNPIPLHVQTYHRKLPIYSYMILLQQIKTLTNHEGKINFQIFKKYMQKRKKSNLLHPNILQIDFDTTEQYLVKDGYLYMKQLALAVILSDVQVFDDDQLAKYRTKLLQQQLTAQQKLYKNKPSFSQQQNNSNLSQKSTHKKRLSLISAFPTQRRLKLNQLVLMDGTFDEQQQYIIRHFIFEVFRQSRNQYVQAQDILDTLSIFDQIQVLRYGDTVMMLNV